MKCICVRGLTLKINKRHSCWFDDHNLVFIRRTKFWSIESNGRRTWNIRFLRLLMYVCWPMVVIVGWNVPTRQSVVMNRQKSSERGGNENGKICRNTNLDKWYQRSYWVVAIRNGTCIIHFCASVCYVCGVTCPWTLTVPKLTTKLFVP